MDNSPIEVKVTIFGQEYSIRTTADARYIKAVADYVNFKMDEVQESAPETSSQLRIAVLAAMNITDELYQEQESKARIIDSVEAKSLAIRDYIDERIATVETPPSKS